MPQDTTYPAPKKSLFGSIRGLGRKKSNNPFGSDYDSNNMINPSPGTRRPNQTNTNPFADPSTDAPPAYTPSNVSLPNTIRTELPSAVSNGESPYAFLATFDTILLVDDSGSMAGRSWREVSTALSYVAPIITSFDSDGCDLYFLNHKSKDTGIPTKGIAPSGYRSIKRSASIKEIFDTVRPSGGTPTGTRVHHILRPYLTYVEQELSAGREVKPVNLIVLTDGVPSDDVESVLIAAAKKLDRIDAPPYQVGVQFFQVGNEEGAKAALMELDDELGSTIAGGVRDIVDTVTWTGSNAEASLTGDGILKVVLGSVVRRLDRRRASSETGRRPAELH